MPEFTKVWSVANIALIKLTAKLASSVHIAQSSRLLCKIIINAYCYDSFKKYAII